MTKPAPTKPAPPSTHPIIIPRTSRATIHKRNPQAHLWPHALPGMTRNERLEVAVLLVAHAHSSREFQTHY